MTNYQPGTKDFLRGQAARIIYPSPVGSGVQRSQLLSVYVIYTQCNTSESFSYLEEKELWFLSVSTGGSCLTGAFKRKDLFFMRCRYTVCRSQTKFDIPWCLAIRFYRFSTEILGFSFVAHIFGTTQCPAWQKRFFVPEQYSLSRCSCKSSEISSVRWTSHGWDRRWRFDGLSTTITVKTEIQKVGNEIGTDLFLLTGLTFPWLLSKMFFSRENISTSRHRTIVVHPFLTFWRLAQSLHIKQSVHERKHRGWTLKGKLKAMALKCFQPKWKIVVKGQLLFWGLWHLHLTRSLKY